MDRRPILKFVYGASLPAHDSYLLMGAGVDGALHALGIDDDDGTYYRVTMTEAPTRIDAPPADLVPARSAPNDHPLNISGARHEGDRMADRIDELAHPLTIAEKMALAERLSLPVIPPQIIGLSESAVLSSATVGAGWSVVCRRLRVAHAVPMRQTYTTAAFHIAHLYHPRTDPHLTELWSDFDGITWQNPFDCVAFDDYIAVLDCGAGDHPAHVGVWRVDLTNLTETTS